MPENPGIKVRGLKSPWGYLAPILVHQTGRPILNHYALKEFLKQDFDVIHFNNISLIGGPKIYQYGTGIKLVTCHDYWILCPLSTLFKYGREICTSKDCFFCSLRAKKPPQLWRYTSLLEESVKHVDAFISPSRFLMSLFSQQGFQEKFFHIPNFVETEDAALTAEEDALLPKPYFLFAGRLEKTKGVQNIIPIFKDGKYGQLVIAGDGSYRSELERLAQGVECIRFLGYLRHEELMRYYRQAEALLVPSIWYENAPLVVIDAMRLGVPVIAHDVAGPGELVRDSGAGLLYQNGEGLRVALKKIKEREHLRREFGKKGREYFQKNLTIEAHLDMYFSLIDQIRRR